jgi:type II secretory pathway predicted ATPase ExeA
MQIILAGQPQLDDKLASPHLLQQRISIMARLNPLTAEETDLYICAIGCKSRAIIHQLLSLRRLLR